MGGRLRLGGADPVSGPLLEEKVENVDVFLPYGYRVGVGGICHPPKDISLLAPSCNFPVRFAPR